ncbi:hypothetical protein EA187_08380 [Lujinxingia sediminis]|uniref:Lipoprotein n=1 Tax=Lujinxingia sediminis TaxID=2480984 RepID=A0ABY0CUB9_9DELT|nr:hypothetical protein [Lujinxingia sediminis]RVU45770.1 hypothetical protein EA187_08380 [Lujinxingia sediminis]
MSWKKTLILAAMFGVSGCTPTYVYVTEAPRERPAQGDDAAQVQQASTAPAEVEEQQVAAEVEVEEVDIEAVEERSESAPPRASAQAEIWEWKLEVGEELELRYEATSDIEMKMGGQMGAMMGAMMGGGDSPLFKDRVEMSTTMRMEVVGMAADGRYELAFHVDAMEMRGQWGGATSVDDLPEEVRTLRAYMDRSGRLEFFERVVVEITEEGPVAVLRYEVGEDGISMSSTVDGVEVSSSARIDPNTGRVTLHAGTRQVERTRQTRTEEQERPVQHLDVLPVQVLSLLELPEGTVAAGDVFEADFPVGKVKTTAGPKRSCEANSCGTLRIELDVDSQQMIDGTVAAGRALDESDNGFGDDFGDDDFFDDEFDADMAMVGAASPTLTSEVDATTMFNVEEGRIHSVEGTFGNVAGSQGVEIREATRFTLVF